MFSIPGVIFVFFVPPPKDGPVPAEGRVRPLADSGMASWFKLSHHRPVGNISRACAAIHPVRTAMIPGKAAPRLAKFRASLRERMSASPLLDAPRFARNIGRAYREMWRAWCGKGKECRTVTGDRRSAIGDR